MQDTPPELGETGAQTEAGEPQPQSSAATGSTPPRPVVLSDSARTVLVAFVSAVVGGLLVLLGNFALGTTETGNSPATRVVQVTEDRAGGSTDAALSAAQIFERVGGSVVHITARSTGGTTTPGHPFGTPFQRGDGSGFFTDSQGHLVTNAHVVQGASSVKVTLADGKEFTASIVGMDLSSDVALLKISAPGEKITPAEFGDSSKLEVGVPVYAIGNPFGEFDRSLSHGIVSAIGRTITAPNDFSISNVIQTDAAVNPGNSGGPLLDTNGLVIGVNAQIAASGDQFSGVAFAIPSNTVRKVVNELMAKGKVVHAWLGVQGEDVTAFLVENLKLSVDDGALMAAVSEGGPAAKAGIKGGSRTIRLEEREVVAGGDIIVEFGGKKVGGMNDLVKLVDARRPGERVNVVIVRNGKRETKQVTLGERPETLQP